MLSNPNSSLHQRQRQHRRQNSTPTIFDTPKVPSIPSGTPQRQASHRRGQSVDQRLQRRHTRRNSRQENGTVSINPGLLKTTPQHVLREAQQQRIPRPGQGQPQPRTGLAPGDQNWEQSPDCFDTDSNHAPAGRVGAHALYNQSSNASNIGGCRNAKLNRGDSAQTVASKAYEDTRFTSNSSNNNNNNNNVNLPAGYHLDGVGHDVRRQSGIPEGHVATRVDAFERRSLGGSTDPASIMPQRSAQSRSGGTAHMMPNTPPHQNASSKRSGPRCDADGPFSQSAVYLPITPEKTPASRSSQADKTRRLAALVASSDQDETIKASRARNLQSVQSCKDIFKEDQFGDALPSPPHTGRIEALNTFDMATMPDPNFMSMSNLNVNFSGSENGYDSSYYSPLSTALSPSQSEFLSSPEMENLQLFENATKASADLRRQGSSYCMSSSQSATDLSGTGSGAKDSSSPRPVSIAGLDADATIEDTGISVDDIATFIQGPDPNDGRWTCLFPECNKKFGRKENIKSHVQTHLGDRQFRCNYCKKCFVRQHDLKRHAKIHSGVKPYPCLCGNSFARHDALTRHRQRGMCIGAFEGVVRKVVKRGRPRKHRPEDDERRSKASRTRKHAIAMSATSSSSGVSVHSQASSASYQQDSPPPSSDTFGSSDHGSPFEVLNQGFEMATGALGMQHDLNLNHFTPPTSPRDVHGADFVVSPQSLQKQQQQQQHHHHSPAGSDGLGHAPSSFSPSMQQQQHQQHVIEDFHAQDMLPSLSSASGTQGGQDPHTSQYSTPPELCLSLSSPPPSSSSTFFDLDNACEEMMRGNSDQIGMSSAAAAAVQDLQEFALPALTEQAVDDMFFDFSGANNAISGFDKDSAAAADLLLFDKFDGNFGVNTDDLFADNGATTDMLF
ncbi:MAG: hypothetical protein M1825_000082 [Sarcosagium campestre]|nr:MAG: hypothetical protein M1825_000082 [Sarcosagium campestre]